MGDSTETFVPKYDLIQEDECDTLVLYVPGFTREQMRVQLTRLGGLKISGTRPLGDNKFSTFQEDFQASPDCDTNKITAKFEGGILYIRQPKLIVPAEHKEDKTTPPSETPRPRDPPTDPKSDQKQKTVTKSDDENKQKSAERKAEEKSRETEDGEKMERKREKVRDNVDEKRDPVTSAVGDDYKLKAEKLKMARRMAMAMAVVFAFALGIYVIKFMVSFSKKAES